MGASRDPPHDGMSMIRLLVTGGTFDKVYKSTVGVLDFHHSHVQEILELSQCQVTVTFETLMLKDSLDITDADRMVMARAISACPENRILITHGTDTMSETGRFLQQHVRHKTVVLTGALIPFSMPKSDALFNLGSAMAFAQYLKPQVYIVMNGRCILAEQARKHRPTGIFEALEPMDPSHDPAIL